MKKRLNNVILKLWNYPYKFLVLAPFVLFSKEIFTGKAFFWGLPILQFIPWRVFLLDNLQEGIFPLWNNLNGFGAPFIANYQSAALYPPSWVLGVFYWLGNVGWLAYGFSLLTITHLVLASLGMALLLRRMGLSVSAQNLGGVVFSLSGFMIYRMGFYSMIWTAAWLPWILLSFTPSPTDRKPTWYPNLQGVFFITMLFLAGHAQLAYYSMIITTLWVAYYASINYQFANPGYMLIKYIASVILAGGISAIQLIPTAELLLNSQRASEVGYESGMAYSFWGPHFLNFLNPGWFGSPAAGNYWGYGNAWEDAVYIGVLPLLLSILSIMHVIKKSKFRGIVIGAYVLVGISVLLALGKFIPFYEWLYRNIPTFNMFQSPARWMFITTFCLAILSGLGLEHFTRPSGKLRYWLNLAAMGAVAIGFGSLIGLYVLSGIEPTVFRSMLGFGVVLFITLLLWLHQPVIFSARNAFASLILVFVIIDLIVASWGFQPSLGIKDIEEISTGSKTSGMVYIDSKSEYWMKFRQFFRFTDFRPLDNWTALARSGLPNINLLSKSKSANNFDPLVPAVYDGFMQRLEKIDLESQIKVLSRLGVNQFISINHETPTGLNIITLPEEDPISWSMCATYVENKDQVWSALTDSSYATPIIESGYAGASTECKASNTKITITNEYSGYMSLMSDATSPGWVVFRQTNYPGWSVYVDGMSAKMYMADYLFMAVPVPAGHHEVIWRYDPVSYKIGGLITFLSLLVMFIVWKLSMFRER